MPQGQATAHAFRCLALVTLASEVLSYTKDPFFLGYPDQVEEASMSQTKPIGSKHRSHDKAFTALVRWLRKDCGAQIAPLVHREFRGILGLGAGHRFAEGDALARIPSGCILGTHILLTPHKIGALSPLVQLKVYLAEQRRLGAKSWWSPYLNTLPSLTDFALFLPIAAVALAREPQTGERIQLATDLAPFADLPVVQKVLHYEDRLWSNYEKYRMLAQNHSEYKPVPWLDFVWAACILQTRSYKIDSAGHPGLVPLLDLSNTVYTPDGGGGSPSAVWHQKLEGGKFVLRADTYLQPGDEVTVRYWFQASQSFSLQTYGFLGGYANWRSLSEDLNPSCEGWLRAAAAVRKEAATRTLVSNLATIAEQTCADRFHVIIGKIAAEVESHHQMIFWICLYTFVCLSLGFCAIKAVFQLPAEHKVELRWNVLVAGWWWLLAVFALLMSLLLLVFLFAIFLHVLPPPF